jgi:hypothetical protein
MPPLIVDVATSFRASILRREADQMQRLAARWRDVEQALLAEMELVANDVLERRAAGRTIDRETLLRIERYQALLRDARVQLVRFGDVAVREITTAQRTLAETAIEHAGTLIRLAAGGRDIGFNQLAVGAVENMVGIAGDGSPLNPLLRQAFGDGLERMTTQLIRSTALGRNPRQTAELMAQGNRAALNRTLVVARNEQLRVYREASRQQYEASGVVQGFRRLATRDTRTCIACIMSDGEEYSVNETLREHVQGRCAMIPIVVGVRPVQWQRGPTWFREQNAATQRSILGPGKYEAWRAGKFDLDQLVNVRRNATWGDSVQVAPLSELVGAN